MKKLILCVWTVCALAMVAPAQSQKKKSVKKQTVKTKTRQTNSPVTASTVNTTSLSATTNYSAKAVSNPISLREHYTIADPTLRALSARAAGSDIKISSSGIVGMPKSAYGFANGHLILYSTGATSSGTITGTGTTGTGSSLSSIGSEGPAIGLNGKSPYAGSTMWGNAI